MKRAAHGLLYLLDIALQEKRECDHSQTRSARSVAVPALARLHRDSSRASNDLPVTSRGFLSVPFLLLAGLS